MVNNYKAGKSVPITEQIKVGDPFTCTLKRARYILLIDNYTGGESLVKSQ